MVRDNLAAARVDDAYRVYRRTAGGWLTLTRPMAHWQMNGVAGWKAHELPTAEPTPAPLSGWLSVELAALYGRTRTHPRFTFPYDASGIHVSVDGRPVRRLTRPPARKRDFPLLVPLLTQAAWLGWWHGRCDPQAELAATLDGRHTPGHPSFDLPPGRNRQPVVRVDGVEVELTLPDGIRPHSLAVEMCNAMEAVARIAGRMASEEGQPRDNPPEVDYFRDSG